MKLWIGILIGIGIAVLATFIFLLICVDVIGKNKEEFTEKVVIPEFHRHRRSNKEGEIAIINRCRGCGKIVEHDRLMLWNTRCGWHYDTDLNTWLCGECYRVVTRKLAELSKMEESELK